MRLPRLDPKRDLFALTLIAAILSLAGLLSLVLVEKQAADAQTNLYHTHMRVAEVEEARRSSAGVARAEWQSAPFRMEREMPHNPAFSPKDNARLLRADLAAYLDEFPPTKE